MKWLFLTLVLLNVVVFAGMIGNKMLKQHTAALEPKTVATNNQPTIIIQAPDGNALKAASSVVSASGVTTVTMPSAVGGKVLPENTTNSKNSKNGKNNKDNKNNNTEMVESNGNNPTENTNNNNKKNNKGAVKAEPMRPTHNNNHVSADENQTGTARAKYKECSARVSIPEDDYHRIKGLLGRYPHAASRQVVDNGNGESAARMNVVFMQVSDQEASAIQGVVGRYGQLNRSACNR